MGDTLITIVAIVLAAVLMFVFPLMTVSDRGDDISQLAVQNTTVEYVDSIRTTGKLSLQDYTKFVQTINATGNSFDVEIELKVLDENPGKKAAQTEVEKIGENIYYTMYTSQIMEQINPDPTTYPDGRTLALKEGDIISVDVGACYKGYHGDSAWTYAVGKISDKAKHLMEVCEGSLELLL